MIDQAGLAPIFRDEWPRLLALLVRDFGDLDIAEDAAQEAFVEAATRWSGSNHPDKPGAWLLTVARRKAIDRARRTNNYVHRLAELETQKRRTEGASEQELVDDQLALLLGCCHPALNLDAQVALTLRVVAGLSTHQIAKAFLTTEHTMVRRITRAKAKIRAANIRFSVPDHEQLQGRIGSVARVVYLIFNEGHTSATVASLVRGDLCDEAIWLSDLLGQLLPQNPEVLGLAALIQLCDSRRATRIAEDGSSVLLADQDRSRWDQEKIQRGLAYLGHAHSLGQIGPYQIQAAIAALHATASSFDQTNWKAIVSLYDTLLSYQPGPIVQLNRAVAQSCLHGPDRGLSELTALGPSLDGYVYFHSARAELLLRTNQVQASRLAFRRAIECSNNETERSHLRDRLSSI